MRPRISIRGSVRPSARPSVRPSVGVSIMDHYASLKIAVFGTFQPETRKEMFQCLRKLNRSHDHVIATFYKENR